MSHRGILSDGRKTLTWLDVPIRRALRFGSTIRTVLAVLTSSLPTLLAMAAAVLFALMAWAGQSMH